MSPSPEADRPTRHDQPQDQYKELFERSADAILIIEGDKFVDCNRATVEMLRYSTREELLQTHPSELSPEFQPDGQSSFEKANQMIAIARERGSHRFEWDHVRSDGDVFPVEVLLTPVTRDGLDQLHVVWRDITLRKRLENELRQAQKMEALGRLTGGIAHDFNNLLVAILGYAELLQVEIPPNDPAHEHVEQIRRAGDRAADLVRQLLTFSRKQVVQPQVIELGQLLGRMNKLLEPIIGENIRYVTEASGTPLNVLADPGQLEQVVLNLATNSRDAMAGAGELSIALERTTSDAAISAGAELEAGDYAALMVTDTGQGIPPALLDKIFEPFFTTKGPDEGTGLGLSTVHGIAKQAGGDVTVESTEGRGTTVRIYLPLTTKAPRPEAPTARVDRPRATETLLLVEDEPAVSRLIAALLKREGYVLHTATNGREALDLVEKLNLHPDLLLTDVIMPEMGGPELARHMARRQSDLKVLFASGYTGDELVARGTLAPGVELIQKPFPPSRLLERIRQILDRR